MQTKVFALLGAVILAITSIPGTPAAAAPPPGSRVGYDVRIELIGRDGKQAIAPSEAVIADLNDPEGWYFAAPGETLQLPAGRYAAIASAYSPVPGQWTPAMTSVAQPEFEVTGPRTLTLDARPGQRIDLRVEQPDAQVIDKRAGLQLSHHGRDFGLSAGGRAELYAVPTKRRYPHLAYYLQAQLEKPQASVDVIAPDRFKVPVEWALDQPRLIGHHELAVVDAGHARPEDLKTKDLHGKLAVFTLDADEVQQYGVRVKALADRGAKAAALYLTALVQIPARDGSALPVVISLGKEGSQLARSSRAILHGATDSPYRYELAFPHLGGLPAGRTFRPANSELATVHAEYHALEDDQLGHVNTEARVDGLEMFGFPAQVRSEGTQTQYFSPAPVSWSKVLRTGGQTFRPAESSYAKGQFKEQWGKAVLSPFLSAVDRDGQPLATRLGNSVEMNVPLRTDSAGNLGFVGDGNDSFGDSGDTELLADGKLIGRSGLPGRGTFRLPAAPATVQLISTVNRTDPKWPLSNKVRAEWTFTSRATTRRETLPLLGITFDPALDKQNMAPAGRTFTFPVKVHRQAGAEGGPLALRAMEISYDGTSWQPAAIRRTSSGWIATVHHPSGVRFAALRALATDAQGNKLQLTVGNAYRIG